MSGAAFLPDYLRPHTVVRRRRRGSRLLLLAPALLLFAPLWSVQAVQIDGGSALPAGVSRSLTELTGCPFFLLDLNEVRQQVERWPAVKAVDLRLSLGGALSVRVEPAVAVGSLAIGRGWHGISREGFFTGPLAAPVAPVLEGFGRLDTELREALWVAQRVERLSGARVVRVCKLTPADLAVELVAGEASYTLRVTPAGTEAEGRWSELLRAGRAPGRWADLRWDHRMVVAGLGGRE